MRAQRNSLTDIIIKNRKLLISSTLIWFYAFVVDFVVNYFNIKIIYVDSGFVSNIFVAQFTIAVLSFTIITIITGSLSEICCGFSLKEILNFENGMFDFRGFLIVPFINILLTSVFYALDWINAVETMFIFTLALVCFFGIQINKYIFDKNYSYKSIEQEINRRIQSKNVNLILETIKRLIDRLCEIVKDKQTGVEVNVIIKALNTTFLQIQSDESISREIINSSQNLLKNLFSSFNVNYGYKEAVKYLEQIFENCNDENQIYDKIEILAYPLEKVIFYNDIDLYSSQIPFIFENADNLINIDKDVLIFLTYKYFKSIYYGIAISKQYKQSLIMKFVDNITRFYSRDDSKFNIVNEKLILYIVKNIAILERDQELFHSIVSSIFEKNEYSENKTFARVLTYITLVLYSYSFKETEMLSSEFRKEIEGFNSKRKTTINTEAINLNYLISQYNEIIIVALGGIVVEEDQKFRFDYFSRSMKVKSVVWTDEFLVEFMFAFYLLFHENYLNSSMLSFISSWKTHPNDKKKMILQFLISCFDINDKDSNGLTIYAFKNTFKTQLLQLGKWINKELSINNENLRILFEHFNNEMVEIVKQNIKVQAYSVIDFNLVEANSLLNEQLRDVFGFNKQILPEKQSKRLYINPTVHRKEFVNNKMISDIVKNSLFTYLNDYISIVLPKIELSFDIRGVRTLLKAIEKYPADIRNYTFTEDWAIAREARETIEYKQLVEKENEIQYKNLQQIRNHLYLNSKDFEFSIEILEIQNRLLSKDELDVYTEVYKAANGLFNIDGSFVNKSEAMRLIKSSHQVISITIGFKTTISKRNGFLITFDYGKDTGESDLESQKNKSGEQSQ